MCTLITVLSPGLQLPQSLYSVSYFTFFEEGVVLIRFLGGWGGEHQLCLEITPGYMIRGHSQLGSGYICIWWTIWGAGVWTWVYYVQDKRPTSCTIYLSGLLFHFMYQFPKPTMLNGCNCDSQKLNFLGCFSSKPSLSIFALQYWVRALTTAPVFLPTMYLSYTKDTLLIESDSFISIIPNHNYQKTFNFKMINTLISFTSLLL